MTTSCAVFAGRAGAQLAADPDLGDVPDPHGHAAARGDHDVADLVHVLEAPGGAHDVALAVALEIAGAAVDVVALQRLGDVGKGQAEADELRRVGLDVVLLLEAADHVDAGDARHGLELRADDPVLDGSQVGSALDLRLEALPLRRQVGAIGLPARLPIPSGGALAGRPVVDRPHVDLAQARRDRAHAHLGAGRQARLGFGEALADLLAREVDVELLVEDRRDLREAVARERARVFEARDAGERRLDRICDLLLDVSGRQRGCDRVDLHLIVGDVRHRIDRQLGQGPHAEGRSGEGKEDHEPALVDRERENALDHDLISLLGVSARARLQPCRVRP